MREANCPTVKAMSGFVQFDKYINGPSTFLDSAAYVISRRSFFFRRIGGPMACILA